MKRLIALAAWAALGGAVGSARADEGMWTFNDFARPRMQKKYGFAPDEAWLEHVRLSSVNLGGCSSSFVSPNGLILTNHHCARSCIQNLSTAGKDYAQDGFYAKSQSEELSCPGMEAAQLVSITDVTERIAQATRGLPDKQQNEARK